MTARTLKTVGFLSATVLLLGACGSSELLGPDAAQGIDGSVLLGPQCPVQSQENPCPDLPYQAWIDIRTAEGATVTRVRSDADGHFRIGLRPGSYVVDPESGNPFPVASAQTVEVVAGLYADVVVRFDTGIR
jgi:hypothetical protein